MNTWDALAFDGFSDLPLLDGHVHVWPGLDPAALWEVLHRSGAYQCNALSISRMESGTLNAEAAQFKAASQGRAYAFGALDYSPWFQGSSLRPDDLVRQAAALQAQGFDGIKMVEGKPAYAVRLPDTFDGPFFEPFFAWAEAESFPILLHLADPVRLWDPARAAVERWSYAGGDYPTLEEQYAQLQRILARHPGLPVIVAHLLFLWDDLPQASRFLDAHPSATLDLTPGVEGYLFLSRDPDGARDFLLRYQDRLIYGTDIGARPLLDPDAPWHTAKEAAPAWLVRTFLETEQEVWIPPGLGGFLELFGGQCLRGVRLPREALEKICRGNFVRVVGGNPRRLPPEDRDRKPQT